MIRFASGLRFVFEDCLGQRGPGGAFEPRVLLSANYLDRLRVALIDNQSAVKQVWFASSTFVRP